MTSWIKNALMVPVNYGMDQANYLISNLLAIIFNVYGNKLLRIENDKIVKSCQCLKDYNIFHLYPIYIREIEQDIELNTLKIDRGTITNTTVSIPRKSFLVDATVVNVDVVTLDISLSRNDNSLYFSTLENSYLLNSNVVKKNEDLLNVYLQINSFLTQYFYRIHLGIKTITINVLSHCRIVICDLSYHDNHLTISSISLFPISGEENKLLEIVSLSWEIIESRLKSDGTLFDEHERGRIHIYKVGIQASLSQYLPNIYFQDTNNKLRLLVTIDRLVYDSLSIKGLVMEIVPDGLVVKNFENGDIFDIATITPCRGADLVTFDVLRNICRIFSSFSLEIVDLSTLCQWLKKSNSDLRNLFGKFVFLKDNSCHSPKLSIIGFDTKISCLNRVFECKLGKISIPSESSLLLHDRSFPENFESPNNSKFSCQSSLSRSDMNFPGILELVDVSIKYCSPDSMTAVIKNVTVKQDSYHLVDITIQGNDFWFRSDMTDIHQMERRLNFDFKRAKVMDLVNMIRHIIDLVNSCNLARKADDVNKPALSVYLSINDSSVIQHYLGYQFKFIINQGRYHINEYQAIDVDGSILINDQVLVVTYLPIIGTKVTKAEFLKLRINPGTLDQLIHLFQVVLQKYFEKNSHKRKECKKRMLESFIVSDLEELERDVDYPETSSQPNLGSSNDLRFSRGPVELAIIEDYITEKLEINNVQVNIKILDIALSDDLKSSKEDPETFLRIILKEVGFTEVDGTGEKSYLFNIMTGGIIDTTAADLAWKYFVKSAVKSNLLEFDLKIIGGDYHLSISVAPLVMKVREGTLLRLLSFFSQPQMSKSKNVPITMKRFYLSAIQVSLSYCPLILEGMQGDILTIKDFQLVLSSQLLENVDGVDQLFYLISQKWKDEINPSNIAQFIPSIKGIGPYIGSLVQMFHFIRRYLKEVKRDKKIRYLTKNINFVSNAIRSGAYEVYEFFR